MTWTAVLGRMESELIWGLLYFFESNMLVIERCTIILRCTKRKTLPLQLRSHNTELSDHLGLLLCSF